jgi:hypothetical protein
MIFTYGTDGFYGTVSATYWEALHPQTVAQSDDVGPCSSWNGLETDEEVSVMLLVLLLPLLPLRAAVFHWQPGWWEVALFCFLSAPSLIFHFSLSYCADIPLTIIVGHNVALAACIAGWVATLIFYLLPADRTTRYRV